MAATMACVTAGTAVSQQEPPQFRALRQLIRFDVTVLDDQRRPVTELGPSDFELLENGVQREVAACSRIDVPGPAAAPRWALDAPYDVVAIVFSAGNRRPVDLTVDRRAGQTA